MRLAGAAYRRISLADRQTVCRLRAAGGSRTSDLTFSNLFL
jgi:hypothetical protein